MLLNAPYTDGMLNCKWILERIADMESECFQKTINVINVDFLLDLWVWNKM